MTDQFFRDDSDDAYDEPAEPARRSPGRRRWLWVVLAVLVAIALVIVGVLGYYSKAALDGLDTVKRDPTLMPSKTEARPEPVPTKEGESNPPINVVLMGTDARNPDTERGRSDVLIVMHIPGNRENAYLVSFPRDYWVEIPGHGTAKINAAYSYGGPALAVETLEQLLDVPMNHTAIINFEGFINVIDTLGGVTVQNKHASSSGGFSFPRGPVELNGESALVYVRERYQLPEGDFDRTERQRAVIQAIVGKVLSAEVLTNPAKFRDVVAALGPNFTVDEGLSSTNLINLGISMRINSGEDIRSLMAPTGGLSTSADGQSIVLVDEAKLAELAAAMREDRMNEYYAQNS